MRNFFSVGTLIGMISAAVRLATWIGTDIAIELLKATGLLNSSIVQHGLSCHCYHQGVRRNTLPCLDIHSAQQSTS